MDKKYLKESLIDKISGDIQNLENEIPLKELAIKKAQDELLGATQKIDKLKNKLSFLVGSPKKIEKVSLLKKVTKNIRRLT